MRDDDADERLANIYCSCGHASLVRLPQDIIRPEILRRARCTVCGKRGAAKDVKMASTHQMHRDAQREELAREDAARAARLAQPRLV